MKALSIQQPWAWLVANGVKDIENRNWQPSNHGLKFRGHFLIHAGKQIDTDFDYRWAMDSCKAYVPKAEHTDRGGIVGIAEIVDVVTESASPWFFGPYGLVIQKARPLAFMPHRGMLGFFDVPDALLAEHYGAMT